MSKKKMFGLVVIGDPSAIRNVSEHRIENDVTMVDCKLRHLFGNGFGSHF